MASRPSAHSRPFPLVTCGRRRLALAGGLLLLSLTLPLAGTWPVHAAPRAPAASGPFSGAEPVNVVILADESGSIARSPGAIAGERQAASEIIQEEWSPQSQIAVYGFGSAPPMRGAQASEAVQQYCGLTPLTGPAARDKLLGCASAITPRRQPQGWNTDFAAALNQAETVLSPLATSHSAPIVFILTDGKLDVSAPNPYAATAAAGTADAQNGLTTSILPGLKQLGAQVWPVGFGLADRQELALFASSGAQANPQCPDRTSTPGVAIVPPGVTGAQEAQDIQQKLLSAFAAARCGAMEQQPWRTLAPGQSTTYQVTVNPLTTFGSFVVNKGDPRVVVSYTDPGQHTASDSTAPPTGQLGPADYILTTGGPASPLESLRVGGPLPGPWQVTLTNKTQLPQTVNVSVVWQGQVQPDVTFSPQVGASGQTVRISVRPAAGGVPVPARELAGLTVGLTVQWTPSSAPQQVRAIFSPAAGAFTGTVRVPPGSSGNAQVKATIQADGVQGSDDFTLPFRPGGGLSVSLSIPPGTTVAPGGTVSALAQVDNLGQQPTNIVFSLGGLGPDVYATIAEPSGTVHVRSGRMPPIPVTISFGPHTRLGPTLGTIQWAVAGQGAITPADWRPADYLDVDVENPPAPLWEQWWLWTLVALVLGGAAGGLFLRKRVVDQDRRDVQHVGVALIRPDGPDQVPYLTWERGFTDVRWFDVRRVGETASNVLKLSENTGTSAGLLELRRDRADRALLLTVHAPRKADPPRPGQAAKPTATKPGANEPPLKEPTVTKPPPDEPLRPKPGTPFPLPEGAGLPGCQLVLAELPRKRTPDGKHPYYKVPPSVRSSLTVPSTAGTSRRTRIVLGRETSRPRITLNDSLTEGDNSTGQHGQQDGM